MDQHGHEYALACFLRVDRHAHMAAYLAEVDGEPAVTDRADDDAGLDGTSGAHVGVPAATGGKGGRQGSAVPDPVAQHRIDLRGAALPVRAVPARAPVPGRPPGDLLVAIGAVDLGAAARQPHRTLLSSVTVLSSPLA